MASNDPVPALIEQLYYSDRKGKVRVSAAEALGKLRDPRAIEPLLRLARDKRWEVEGAVAQALGLIGDMQALDTLVEMFMGKTYPLIESEGAPHQYDAIVGGAAIGLAHLYRQTGNPEIFEILTSCLGKSADISACIVQGLPYTGDRRVTPLLIQATQAPDERVRCNALEALGILADPDGLPILYTAVRSGNPLTLVWAAADGLASFGNPDADQPLIDGLQRLESELFLKDHVWSIARAKVIRALGMIGTSKARLDLEQRLNDRDSDQRILGGIGLAYMHDKRALPILIKGLSIADWWIQAAVATALGALGELDAISALESRLHDRNVTMRVENAIQASLSQLRQSSD